MAQPTEQEIAEAIFDRDFNLRHTVKRVDGETQGRFMRDNSTEVYEYLWTELSHYVPTDAIDLMLADDPANDGFLQYVARKQRAAYAEPADDGIDHSQIDHSSPWKA